MTKATRIAGVDCAVQPANVGVALGEFDGARCRVLDVRCCDPQASPADVLQRWHVDAPLQLLALDAPLGWPTRLSNALSRHTAGAGLGVDDANLLFRRETDREIHRRLGKPPLEVGADRIARTAWAALTMLDDLRSRWNEPIPLAWAMRRPASVSAIEVYPAATLRSSGLPLVAYKKAADRDGRQRIVEAIPPWIELSTVEEAVVETSHALDAVLCLVAAVDFLSRRCVPPADPVNAEREGWIWAGEAVKT